MTATKASPKIEALNCSLNEAETISGVSRWTWRARAYAGDIESIKVGRRLLIPLSEIHRLLNEGRRPRRDGLPAGVPSSGKRSRRYPPVTAIDAKEQTGA
jgi:hypothetical protein